MHTRWTATSAAVDRDFEADIVEVGLAENADGSGRCLAFQVGLARVPDPDFDEVYCLVTETHASAYGGVQQLELRGRTLGLTLTKKAATALDLPSRRLVLTLDLTQDEATAVRDGLAQVFASSVGWSRPWRLKLPGATPQVRARSVFRSPPWTRGARRGRVTYRVAAVHGARVELINESTGAVDDGTPITFVGELAQLLVIAESDVVGQRFSYMVVPDRWGASFGDLRREPPMPR